MTRKRQIAMGQSAMILVIILNKLLKFEWRSEVITLTELRLVGKITILFSIIQKHMPNKTEGRVNVIALISHFWSRATKA